MENELLCRAWRAYQSSEAADAEQPLAPKSGKRTVRGLHYVVLKGERRLLAAYRIRRSTGKLRRLRRWPIELGRA